MSAWVPPFLVLENTKSKAIEPHHWPQLLLLWDINKYTLVSLVCHSASLSASPVQCLPLGEPLYFEGI